MKKQLKSTILMKKSVHHIVLDLASNFKMNTNQMCNVTTKRPKKKDEIIHFVSIAYFACGEQWFSILSWYDTSQFPLLQVLSAQVWHHRQNRKLV